MLEAHGRLISISMYTYGGLSMSKQMKNWLDCHVFNFFSISFSLSLKFLSTLQVESMGIINV